MMHHPFQIARWALLASFAVMVFVVAFPNPLPSSAWKLAERNRYEQRFPASRKQRGPKSTEPGTQLAKGSKKTPTPVERTARENSETPLRMAHLPSRQEIGDDRPRGVRIQEPIFFEDDEPIEDQLAPDPAHLETPSQSREP